MRHSLTLFTAVLLLLFLGGIQVAQGDDKPTSKDLGKIQPPGGVPLPIVRPGTTEIGVDELNKVRKRLDHLRGNGSGVNWPRIAQVGLSSAPGSRFLLLRFNAESPRSGVRRWLNTPRDAGWWCIADCRGHPRPP